MNKARKRIEKLYKRFQGKDPERRQNIPLPAGCNGPGEVALLGVCRKVSGGPEHLRYNIAWTETDTALVLATAGGTIWIYDADGCLFDFEPVTDIEYETDKGDGIFIYHHEFEEPFPKLITGAGCRHKLAKLAGGGYRITRFGIVD